MKRSWSKLLPVVLSLVLLLGCGQAGGGGAVQPQEGTILVYTSFYPMYDFACKVGGDKVQVVNLVAPGVEPHDWEPTTANMAGLEGADVFIYSGAGMEHWVDSVLSSLSNRESLTVVEASAGLALLDGDDHDDDHGHHHDGVDPHVWLSPLNAKHQMIQIRDGFIAADPDNADTYRENCAYWETAFDQLDQAYREGTQGLDDRHILVAHASFGYLCRDYGLHQVAVRGFSPDGEPDPATMAQLVRFAREHQIPVVFHEQSGSDKVAKAIAEEIEAEVEVLHTLEYLTGAELEAGEDYFSMMYNNLEALKKALS